MYFVISVTINAQVFEIALRENGTDIIYIIIFCLNVFEKLFRYNVSATLIFSYLYFYL